MHALTAPPRQAPPRRPLRRWLPLAAPSCAPATGSVGLACQRPGAGLPAAWGGPQGVARVEAAPVAARADAAAARAARFPGIALIARGGSAGGAASSPPDPAGTMSSPAAGPIPRFFEGGASEAQPPALHRARHGERLADYRPAALAACGNAQAAPRGSAGPAQGTRDAGARSRRACGIAQARRRAGTIDNFTVPNTASALFPARDIPTQAGFAHRQALVGLPDAPGGGWQQTAKAS